MVNQIKDSMCFSVLLSVCLFKHQISIKAILVSFRYFVFECVFQVSDQGSVFFKVFSCNIAYGVSYISCNVFFYIGGIQKEFKILN